MSSGNSRSIKSIAAGLYLAIAAIGLAVVGVASTAHALPITTPTGLSPGDQYRLAFVTSARTIATSDDIADYNSVVNWVAGNQPELLALGPIWKAIASTPTVDARDNTSTRWTDPDAPIYLLDGTTKIADYNMDLWDGSIDNFFNVDESGATSEWTYVWTGTIAAGVGTLNYQLGNTVVSGGYSWSTLGRTDETVNPWVRSGSVGAQGGINPLYALSSILTVQASTIPEPGTLILFGVGLAFRAVARRRSRNTRRS